ncbi:hypothetical protein Ocin01_16320 [Orchesella cincta]|uniref:Uncharacterized protein n=1 Tax=Orchesella cincta TaxID=48709 RepID=A0A1D2MBR7_ORCCI|nr:hypothetical protein Ocin01_16320 [Orchesella cincta]
MRQIPAADSEPPPIPLSSPPPNFEEVQSPLNGNEDDATPPPPSPPENDEVAHLEDDDEDDANADEMEIPLNHLELNAEAGILVDGVNQVEDDELLLVSCPSTSQSDSLCISDLDEISRPPHIN